MDGWSAIDTIEKRPGRGKTIVQGSCLPAGRYGLFLVSGPPSGPKKETSAGPMAAIVDVPFMKVSFLRYRRSLLSFSGRSPPPVNLR
jgi:hypothetical protein